MKIKLCSSQLAALQLGYHNLVMQMRKDVAGLGDVIFFSTEVQITHVVLVELVWPAVRHRVVFAAEAKPFEPLDTLVAPLP